MKKRIIVALVLALLAAYAFGTGLRREGAAFIGDYTVSPDGSEMTVQLGVGSSIGYIRKAAIHRQEGGTLYLDCYCAFGGINGSIGASNVFTIPLEDTTTAIAIYRAPDTYEVVLQKDRDGEWHRSTSRAPLNHSLC